MDFALSDEQEQLRTALRAFLEQRSPESEVRRLVDSETGHDPAVWSQMAQQMGLQGLAIAEHHGGSGFGLVELGIVVEETGRSLLCSPFFATVVLAAGVLQASGDAEAQAAHLPGIASGEIIATLAYLEPGTADGSVATAATGNGDAWLLNGTKDVVMDGATADLLMVTALTAEGISLFSVQAADAGVSCSPRRSLDPTRRLARVELQEAPARLVGQLGVGEQVLATTLSRAAALLAAEQVGAASRTLEMAVAHAKTRVQFGRPIGSFQAVKHLCADMFVELESAKATALYGLWAAEQAAEDSDTAASLALSTCSEAFMTCAATNVQVHGGTGVTWEHSAQMYYRRALSSRLLLGSPDEHREKMLQALDV